MATTLTDSGAVKIRAGANVSTALTNAQYDELINQAESYLSAALRVDLVADYSGYDANKQKVIDMTVSALAATTAINYNMSGYTSRAEALTMINVNWATYREGLEILKEKYTSDFISD